MIQRDYCAEGVVVDGARAQERTGYEIGSGNVFEEVGAPSLCLYLWLGSRRFPRHWVWEMEMERREEEERWKRAWEVELMPHGVEA